MATINWYPGHMAKSRRMLIEQLRAVDAVVELVDARAPLSSANPDLRGLTRGKARLLVLNKADLADDAATSRWLEYYRAKNVMAMRFNSNGGREVDGQPSVGKGVAAVAQRRPHALARFLHCRVRQAHHVEGGHTRREIDFGGDHKALDAGKAEAEDRGEHGVSPSRSGSSL